MIIDVKALTKGRVYRDIECWFVASAQRFHQFRIESSHRSRRTHFTTHTKHKHTTTIDIRGQYYTHKVHHRRLCVRFECSGRCIETTEIDGSWPARTTHHGMIETTELSRWPGTQFTSPDIRTRDHYFFRVLWRKNPTHTFAHPTNRTE